MIDSDFKIGKNFYLQVFLEERKSKKENIGNEKKIERYIRDYKLLNCFDESTGKDSDEE